MSLRLAGPADAAALAAVHGQAFDAAWSEADLAALLGGPAAFALLVEAAGGPCAMVLCSLAAGEAEILTLAVVPAARRQGLGAALVEAAAGLAEASGAETMFLEVAADNSAALGLYRAAGFEQTGVRRGYYNRGAGAPIDALVMRRTLNMTHRNPYSET